MLLVRFASACLAICMVQPTGVSAQSDVAFAPGVYAGQRARMVGELNAPIIVPGRYMIRNGGVDRQDPNFSYPTGVESPYAILVMVPGRDVLFLPDEAQFAGAQFPILDERFRVRHGTGQLIACSPAAWPKRRRASRRRFP